MRPNSVTFTEEIVNGKLRFLFSDFCNKKLTFIVFQIKDINKLLPYYQ